MEKYSRARNCIFLTFPSFYGNIYDRISLPTILGGGILNQLSNMDSLTSFINANSLCVVYFSNRL